MDEKNKYRMENDALGNVMVLSSSYYGAETQRAIDNFKISGSRFPRTFIRAQGIIKAASATVNMQTNKLEPDIAKAIIAASEEVIEGKLDNHFVVDVFQAGAGTSQNMNANEVIARRATEILGKGLQIHAHDHVNMSQSTNDTFPSALNIAASESLTQRLLPIVAQLNQELEKKSEEFMPVLKAGRTHLHDGVPMLFGQEISGYSMTINKLYNQLNERLNELYEIGLGGNAIGTKINLADGYIPKVIQEICKRTNLPFRAPQNMFSFMQNMNAPIRCMLTLKELAVHLIKITSDLRLLSSGPRTALSEVNLPPVQPGSTIMPGKVNPAILEMTHMVCCQIIGNETAVAVAGLSGQLEINVFMPFIAHTLLQSIDLMANAIETLTLKCITGLQANEKICKKWMERSLSLVTGLSPLIGYDCASQIGLKADDENKTIKQILDEQGYISKEIHDAINPNLMI